MPIIYSDLKVFLAETNDDTGANGGVMSQVQAISGLPGQIWPAVSKAERDAGSLKYRKIYHKNDSADDTALQIARVCLWNPVPGDASVTIAEGTHTDTQEDVTGGPSRQWYGAGRLAESVIQGATEIIVEREDVADYIFGWQMLIRISNMVDDLDEEGTEDYIRIGTHTTSESGDYVLQLLTPLPRGYSAEDTLVSGVLEAGTVAASVSSLTVTSAAGELASANLKAHNKGAVQQGWTLTFTNASTFTVAGNTVGPVGSGNVGSNCAPLNPDTATPYFTLQSAGFSGTFSPGDTITFTTSPSAVPVWVRRRVPEGAAAATGTSANTFLYGESP